MANRKIYDMLLLVGSGQKCVTFGSELSDVICQFPELLEVD